MSGTDRESRVGTQFGHYRLRRLLGRGGMGEVYEAEDTVKDRVVALKLLPEGASHDPVFRKRLQREAHSAGRLQEPHVVPIHDYGEIDGVLYVDMRMIDGTDLRKVLSSYGPMTPARAVAIVRQVASALDAAHESGVMHRDVKPENVLITRDDFAYLVDFGIANAATDEKLTELGTAVGTYAYMAPERFTNDEVTYRADIYALTCVLHECLTGAQPYKADSVSVIITSHMMQPIPRPSEVRPGIPAAFDQVIARGMAKKPEDRYASAGDLAVAAHEALTSRDQDQEATILQRSEAATFPGGMPPLMTPPPAGAPRSVTPPPQYPTPPPAAASYTPPPTAPPVPPQGPTGPAAFTTPYPPTGGPPGGGAPWGPPTGPQPSGPRKTNTGLIVGLAAAAVVVIVLAGIGIWAVTRSGSASNKAAPTTTTTTTTTRTTTTRSTTTSTGTATASDSRLINLLPAGYSITACEPVHPPASGALATVDCGRNTEPGGPEKARYSLFGDLAALNAQFDASIKLDSELLQCPGNTLKSPTTWHYQNAPDKPAGQIACGTYEGGPDVTWTKEAELLYGDAQGPNLDQLHQWWFDHG
jgi:serine/threonine kinase PknH